jgi:hypothetical protein
MEADKFKEALEAIKPEGYSFHVRVDGKGRSFWTHGIDYHLQSGESLISKEAYYTADQILEAHEAARAQPVSPPSVSVDEELLAALKENHQWHQDYDEYGGYPESALCTQNIAAIQRAEASKAKKPPYPEGDVVGSCVCGSWPGGKCLRCQWTPATDPAKSVEHARAAPEGWRLVPIDPDKRMLDRAEAIDWGDEDVRGSCMRQWHAMLDCAPEPKS